MCKNKKLSFYRTILLSLYSNHIFSSPILPHEIVILRILA